MFGWDNRAEERECACGHNTDTVVKHTGHTQTTLTNNAPETLVDNGRAQPKHSVRPLYNGQPR